MDGRARWAAFGVLLAAVPARAQAPLAVQVGDHPGFGRVVFDFPWRVGFQAEAEGNRVRVRFEDGSVAPGDVVPDARDLPRNVLSITGRDGVTEIVVAPGARARSVRMGNRVVVDVLDPPPGTRPGPAPAMPRPPIQEIQATLRPAPPAGRPPAPATAAATPTPRGGAPRGAPAEAPPPPAPSRAPAPVPARAPAPAPAPVPAPSPAAAPVPAPTRTPAAVPAAPATVAVPASPLAPATPPTATIPVLTPPASTPPASAGPVALAARPMRAEAPGEASVLVPFGLGVGAAAFRSGDAGVVVFDERRPLDLGPLRDAPLFTGATVQLLPAGTVLRLKLPADTALRLARRTEGWQITASPRPAAAPPIQPRLSPTGIGLDVGNPGRVVAVPDAESGQTLLVGTLTPSAGGAAGVAASRRTPEFVLGATWQGVVVDPLSDRLQLRATGTGFLLSAQGAALAASDPSAAAAPASAAALTRRFDFPALPTDALVRRMQAQIAAASAAPARARTRDRVAAAQTMIALGLGTEAHAVLLHAAAEDPHAAETPELGGLTAVAALLAGRPAETDGLDDPRLSGTDEIALWRAARDATRHEGAPSAAGTFAALAPLVLSYPATLQARLLPLAAETMALGGAGAAADALLKAADDPAAAASPLALTRALRLEASGDADGALAAYDALAAGRDRLARVRATGRAVELRLASGKITPEAAADAMTRLIPTWRGDEREYAVRLRAAELRAQAGGWRPALDLLRETDAAFPDARAKTRERMAGLLTAMLQGDGGRVTPLELVAITEDYAGLMPEGAAGDAAAGLLADKLVALDLPRRAAPVLERLMRAATPGPTRAGLGARLAAMRLEDGDAAAAVAALAASEAPPGTPSAPPPGAPSAAPAGGPDAQAELRETRGLTLARARARLGDLTGAVAVLASLDTAAADEARASLLSGAGDWPAAAAALADLAAKTVPAQGALTPAQQSVLVRWAGAAAQAGDTAVLRALRAKEGARVTAAGTGELFRVLTAEPVRGVADLPRAAEEVAMARALPGRIQAASPGVP